MEKNKQICIVEKVEDRFTVNYTPNFPVELDTLVAEFIVYNDIGKNKVSVIESTDMDISRMFSSKLFTEVRIANPIEVTKTREDAYRIAGELCLEKTRPYERKGARIVNLLEPDSDMPEDLLKMQGIHLS